MLDYGTPTQSALRHADLDELAGMSFPAGSMGPKIEACRRFVATTGMPASIGSINDARRLQFGRYGNPDHGPGSAPDRPSQGSGIQLEMTSIVNPQTPEHPAPTAVPVRVRFSSSACTAPEWGELPRRAPDRVVVNRENADHCSLTS